MVKEESEVWECTCGKQLRISLEEIVKEKRVCPECGEPITWEREAPCLPDPSDTQAVDVRAMAQMAQNGIGVATSGEWDTSDEG